MNEKGKQISIRIPIGKENVYEEFKSLVIDDLHSDICYVSTSLMEAFTNAMKQNPRADKFEMKFLRQNVQINLGCEFNYNVGKSRRRPDNHLTIDKNRFFSALLEQWPTMKEDSKRYWREKLIEQGIIEPEKPHHNIFASLWSRVKQLFARKH